MQKFQSNLVYSSLAMLVAFAPCPAAADSYKVALTQSRNPENKGQYRVAKVQAEITPAAGGIVGLFRNNDDVGLANGWNTFLYKPSAKTRDGKTLGLTMIGEGKMHVDGWESGPVLLEYTMLLQHDRFPSDPGYDELAYARDFGVMWTGRALLMEGAPGVNIEVRFEVPNDWRITAPWQKDPGDPNHFIAKSTDDLLDSAIMAGTQEQLVEPIGKAEARIGVDPAMHDKEAGLVKTLHESITDYQSMFDEAPDESVVVLLSAASFTGGGVMGRSISFLIGPDYPDPKDFHHVLSHELFHLWTADWNRAGAESETEWLVEGSAEYYSYLSGLRVGRLSQDEFLGELGKRYGTYLAALKTTDIAGAGTTKNQNEKSSDAIYAGGMMTFFVLDALIRRGSNSRLGLDDAMKAINSSDKSQPLNFPKLNNILARFGVPSDFLLRFVKGRSELAVTDALKLYGLRVETRGDELAITRQAATSRAQQRAWRAYAKGARI